MAEDNTEDVFANKTNVIKFVRTQTTLSKEAASGFVNWFVTKCPERFKFWEKVALLVDLSRLFVKGDLVLEGDEMMQIKVIAPDELLSKYGLTLHSNGPVTITNKEIYKFPE